MGKYNPETYGKINREKYPNWIGWLIIDKQKQLPDFPDNLKREKEILDDLEYSFLNKKKYETSNTKRSLQNWCRS